MKNVILLANRKKVDLKFHLKLVLASYQQILKGCSAFSFASRGCYLYAAENMKKRKIPKRFRVFSGKINCDGNQEATLDEPEVEVGLDDAKKKMFRSAIKGEKNQGLQSDDISYDDLEALFASKDFKPECDQKLFQDVVAGGGFNRLGGDGLLHEPMFRSAF